MQILIAVLATGVAAIQIPSFNARVTRSDLVLVRSVIDGDTIDVATFGRVRLLGIDAPELGRGYDTSAPFGASFGEVSPTAKHAVSHRGRAMALARALLRRWAS